MELRNIKSIALRTLLHFTLLIATLSLSACSGLTGGQLIREGEPVGALRVVNQSSATITVITVSTRNAASHGFNRLPKGVTLAPGQSYRFTVSNGNYDVQAGYGYATGYSVADFKNIHVPAGNTRILNVQ